MMDILLNSESGFWCTVTHYTKYGSIVVLNVANQNVLIRSSNLSTFHAEFFGKHFFI